MSLKVSNFNPNHRVRFFAVDDPLRFLFDLSSAISDDSFYLVPKFRRDVALQQVGLDGVVPAPIRMAANAHISFHETGAVNLHGQGDVQWLRRTGSPRGKHGLTVRFAFNSFDLFQTASHEEFNSLPGRYTPVPVMGFWQHSPICLDIYQCGRDAVWSMPHLADILQVHVQIQPVRKSSDYHFLVWQHSKNQRLPADVTMLYSPQPMEVKD